MKTIQMLLLLGTLFSSTLIYAQGDQVILRKKGESEPLKAEKIEKLDGDMVTYKDGAVSRRISIKDLSYAYSPKKDCKFILDADKLFNAGDYSAAATAYADAEKRYDRFGWDIYTAARRAECLLLQKQEALAIAAFEKYKDVKLNEETKWKQNSLDDGMATLVTAMATTKNKETLKVAQQIQVGHYPNALGAAHNAEGAMLYDQDKPREAFYSYAKTALLYEKSPYRPEALCRAANIMKELKDSRGGKFADILKTQYPQSPWVKQLK